MGTLRTAFLSAFVLELCAMIGTALVAATIGVQLVAGALSLQAGLTVLLLAPEMYGPLRQVGQQFHASADATSASERIFHALDELADHHVPRHATCATQPSGRAGAPQGGGVRVPATTTAASLSDIDLELAAEKITALVGESGAGKSTIARLLMRLADPTAGEVACGGVDLRAVDLDAWRRQIAWVPQRPTLFTGTIAENIALCRPDAAPTEIHKATCDAGAKEFIDQLPQGLDTPVGQGGRRLSVGQAQRIALARAFLADRPLLLLDEPTAHLDDEGAHAISDTIARLAYRRTTLLIVHHPLLTELADHIHVLHHGRLIDRGQGPSAATWMAPTRASGVPA